VVRPRKATLSRRSPAPVRPRPERPGPPDKDNPLAEPTPQRRLWAAYLARGFNRASFARALGAQYSSLDNWDIGATAMSLETFARAACLVQYTLDELVYGAAAGPSAPPGHLMSTPVLAGYASLAEYDAANDAPELTIEARRALLAELGASADERATFGVMHHDTAAAYYQLTESYIRAWFGMYRHVRTLTGDAMQAGRQACERALRVSLSDGSDGKIRAAGLPQPSAAQPPRLPRGKSA
jgi:hypothetical protein